MYDDPSYHAFVPSSQHEAEKPLYISHQRKTSLIAQPSNNPQATVSLSQVKLKTIGDQDRISSPPIASPSRRAQSYSDFHDAALLVLRASPQTTEQHSRTFERNVRNDLEISHWYQSLEGDLHEASHGKYKAYRNELNSSNSYLSSLSGSASTALDLLTELSESFKIVGAQTTAFQKQCERMLASQQAVTALSDQMRHNLDFYNSLGPITRRLNAPGAGNFVKSKEFSGILARLDECLEYMDTHSSQREADTYRSRYRLLLTRGLTLIRLHFVGALRDIAQDVTRRIADPQLTDTTMSALLYAKFRVGAPELRDIAHEVRRRAVVPVKAGPGHDVEYQSLMNELYTSYSATRGKLVLPLVRKQITQISIGSNTPKDLAWFARSSISYTRGVCSDEYNLWREWFDDEDGLFNLLESVCEPLYDHLRPRIIHENQLAKLCELCTLIQTRYMRDQDDDSESVSVTQFDFSALIQPLLEDTQTRIVFRTLAILKDDIQSFKPKPEDLDYPSHKQTPGFSHNETNGAATSGRKVSLPRNKSSNSADSVLLDDGDILKTHHDYDAGPILIDCYPTLKRAIWLLSRIYRLVNSSVFDDLAHQIVHETTMSLHRASTLLASPASGLDAQLFLLKHLLLLKQQIVAFDIEYVTPEVAFDFSIATNTFYELRDRGGLFDPRVLWRLVGGGLLPRVVENMLDAKVELDGRLRTVINAFTIDCAYRITGTMDELVTMTHVEGPKSVVQKVKLAAEREAPAIRRRLDEYLDDIRTKETLIGAVRTQMVQNYEAFYEWSMTQKKAIEEAVSTKGKGRGDDLWDVDTLAEWSEEVFQAQQREHEDVMARGARRSPGINRSMTRNGSI